MEIDFKKHIDIELLDYYFIFFGTYMGAHVASVNAPRKLGHTEILGDLCTEIRKEYFSRKDADKAPIHEIETSCMNQVKQLSNPEILGKIQRDYENFIKATGILDSKSNDSVN